MFLGCAVRDGPLNKKGRKPELHQAEMAYPYRDFWSYSISEVKWRRERISGNPPLSRTEMGCTFVSRAPSFDIYFILTSKHL